MESFLGVLYRGDWPARVWGLFPGAHQVHEAALESAGVTVLVNQAVALPAPWEQVTVVGLDDPWTGHCDAEAAFATVPKRSSRIVLCHAPDALLQLEHKRFDLFVCGHTHGGQIATPWGPHDDEGQVLSQVCLLDSF